jgi:hypothetical protein
MVPWDADQAQQPLEIVWAYTDPPEITRIGQFTIRFANP